MADKERKSSVADTLQPADGQAEIPVVVAVHIRPLIHDEVVNGCTPCLSVTEGEPQVRTSSMVGIYFRGTCIRCLVLLKLLYSLHVFCGPSEDR